MYQAASCFILRLAVYFMDSRYAQPLAVASLFLVARLFGPSVRDACRKNAHSPSGWGTLWVAPSGSISLTLWRQGLVPRRHRGSDAQVHWANRPSRTTPRVLPGCRPDCACSSLVDLKRVSRAERDGRTLWFSLLHSTINLCGRNVIRIDSNEMTPGR